MAKSSRKRWFRPLMTMSPWYTRITRIDSFTTALGTDTPKINVSCLASPTWDRFDYLHI